MPEAIPQLAVGPRRNGNRSLKSGRRSCSRFAVRSVRVARPAFVPLRRRTQGYGNRLVLLRIWRLIFGL
jgi:hypothetical protein